MATDPAADVMVALRRIVRFLRLAEGAAHRQHGLSAAQLYVLHALVDAPAQSIAEIARRTLTDPSSVSTVVARLVAQKLVSRTVAKADRRRAELALTPAGHRIASASPRVAQLEIIAAGCAAVRSMTAKLSRSIGSHA